MKQMEIKFVVNCEDSAVPQLKQVVENHLEQLVDLESWPEIKSAFGAQAKELD